MKRYNPIVVNKVLRGSIADEAGIDSGDIILSINNEKIADVFDYRYLTANTDVLLEVKKKNGYIWEVEIEKEEYEDLGIEFKNAMISDIKSCNNKCIFCFIDQLPEGMRKSLYFKDDDIRLSYILGNYVTLTNVDNDEIDRIIKYKMTPVNVSVHTTSPDLRKHMLNNKHSGDILEKIKKFVGGGIKVNCQVVLCMGVNDGKILDHTIDDLTSLYPGMNSLSVVPAGITKYRQGLIDIWPYDKQTVYSVIKQVNEWQYKLNKKHNSRVVFLADEFYVLGGIDIPDYKHYEDFPQMENGVGMLASLMHEFQECLEKTEHGCISNILRKVSIATGTSSYPYIKDMMEAVEKKHENIGINVYEIKNNFFGYNVTVTGLLTGGDVVSQLYGKDIGDQLLVSRSMLKCDEDVLLDDYTLERIESELGVRVIPVENNGRDLIEKVLGIEVSCSV